LLILLTGQVADRYNRRLGLRSCYAAAFCSSAGLVLRARTRQPSLAALIAMLGVNSAARGFEQPAMQALGAARGPRSSLSRAIAAHVSARQFSVLAGRSLGGLLYACGAAFDYGVCAMLFLAASVASFLLPKPPVLDRQEEV